MSGSRPSLQIYVQTALFTGPTSLTQEVMWHCVRPVKHFREAWPPYAQDSRVVGDQSRYSHSRCRRCLPSTAKKIRKTRKAQQVRSYLRLKSVVHVLYTTQAVFPRVFLRSFFYIDTSYASSNCIFRWRCTRAHLAGGTHFSENRRSA